ncbi:MAG: hypothetical protein C0505_09555 [Leptothrix sp. (in: Bacteria)]|nr:hypothetical protein [Leptothrix sp. (in: b-proteobacteria)]
MRTWWNCTDGCAGRWTAARSQVPGLTADIYAHGPSAPRCMAVSPESHCDPTALVEACRRPAEAEGQWRRRRGSVQSPSVAGGVSRPGLNVAPLSPRDGDAGLDADALARLRELDPDGGHGVVARVLRAFETSLERMLGQLESARASADEAAVSGIAHTLKSSSASVGALALSRVCAEVEGRLRSGGAGSVAGDIEQLQVAATAALTAVKAMLRQ